MGVTSTLYDQVTQTPAVYALFAESPSTHICIHQKILWREGAQ